MVLEICLFECIFFLWDQYQNKTEKSHIFIYMQIILLVLQCSDFVYTINKVNHSLLWNVLTTFPRSVINLGLNNLYFPSWFPLRWLTRIWQMMEPVPKHGIIFHFSSFKFYAWYLTESHPSPFWKTILSSFLLLYVPIATNLLCTSTAPILTLLSFLSALRISYCIFLSQVSSSSNLRTLS